MSIADDWQLLFEYLSSRCQQDVHIGLCSCVPLIQQHGGKLIAKIELGIVSDCLYV